MTGSAGSSDCICRRVIYTGRVQGVGFRYTTRSIARRYPVTGSVKNLAAGTVELLVQGTASAVENVLKEIGQQFDGYITHADVSERESDDASTGFSIRY